LNKEPPMVFVGIDPGQQGAIAFITKKEEWIIDMPLLPERDIDAKALYNIFEDYKDDDDIYIVIEKAQSMPGQSSVAMFNYGGGYYTILAILKILDLPFEEVRSNKWKKEFGLSGLNANKKKTSDGKKIKKTQAEKTAAQKQRKEMAVKTAMQMFPKLKNEFFVKTARSEKIMDGRAEALLIAAYGKRKLGK